MKSVERRHLEESERYAAASDWHLRLQKDPSLEVSAEYQAWLSDAQNQAAFDGVANALDAARDFAIEPRVLDMRRAALGRVRLAGTSLARTRRWRWMPATPLRLLSSMAVALCLAGALAVWHSLSSAGMYATNVGERRTVQLADGSRVSLDSDSEMRVQYTSGARNIELRHGRAHFDVAHDSARPFAVAAGTQMIVAIGTSFDVERIESKVWVTLITGSIVVKPANSAATAKAQHESLLLVAGQQLVAAVGTKPVVRDANLPVASAWEAGRLIFNGETLADATARVNRYASKPIVVDPSIASTRIIGAFDAGDVASFVSAVTSYFPVQATTTDDNRIVLQPRH